MNKRIWKYTLEITDEQKIDMPYVHKFRHVAPTFLTQVPESDYRERILAERINVWAEVDADTEITPKKFYVCGTGHPLPEDGIFVGTAPMPSGLVWHVFWAAIL